MIGQRHRPAVSQDQALVQAMLIEIPPTYDHHYCSLRCDQCLLNLSLRSLLWPSQHVLPEIYTAIYYLSATHTEISWLSSVRFGEFLEIINLIARDLKVDTMAADMGIFLHFQ